MMMIGKHTAALEFPPRRWLQQLWGTPDIHTRHKWMIVWPHLAKLPATPLRVLDAGCGSGQWSLELAARRPRWSVIGIDHDGERLQQARQARVCLGLANVALVETDFLNYEPVEPADVVISIASAHYLAEAGKGEALFRKFRSWLKPGGKLFLLGPRSVREMPLQWSQPASSSRGVFSAADLSQLCEVGGLTIVQLRPCGGRAAAVAKRLDRGMQGPYRLLKPLVYPLQWSLIQVDSRLESSDDRPTLMWLLIARADG